MDRAPGDARAAPAAQGVEAVAFASPRLFGFRKRCHPADPLWHAWTSRDMYVEINRSTVTNGLPRCCHPFFLLRQEVAVQDSQVAEAAPVAAPRSLAVAGDGAPGNARAVQAVQPAQVVRAGGGPRAAGSLRAPAASQARLTCSSSRPSGPGHAGHPVRASPPLDASVAGGDARGAEASRSTLLEQASFTSGASSTAPYIDIELWHVRRFFVYLDAALRHGLRLIVRYSGLRGD